MINRGLVWTWAAAVAAMVGASACGGATDSTITGPSATSPAALSASAPGGDISSAERVRARTAVLRLRCEQRPGRSKISVDGNNLTRGTYHASVRSGDNTATSDAKPTVGGEVEFDFDSDAGDVAAGATRIASDFIRGGQVTGTILNPANEVVATSTASCESK